MSCRTCGAPIMWGESLAGARVPLDPVPLTVGIGKPLLYQVASGKFRVLSLSETSRGLAAGAVLRSSHFDTCPGAARHRKGGENPAQESLL